MHIGWILDTERALYFVHSHGIYPTVSDERGITPNYYGACLEALYILLDKKTGVIPSDRRIRLVFLCDGQYVPNPVEQGKVNFHLGLSVGTNYDRTIPMKYIEKLGEVIAPGVRPMWYLDMDKWTWTRRSSEKTTKKKHKSTQTEPDTTSDTTGPTVRGKTKTKAKAKAKTKTRIEPPRPSPTTNDTGDVEPRS